MAQQTINIGASPNDGTGTPLRTAFQYTNSNFSELYTAVGPSGNNIVVPGNATISGDLTVRTNKLKVTSIGVGAGTTTPAAILHSTQTSSYDALILDSDGAGTYCIQNWRVGGVQKAQAFLDVADDSLLIRTNTATGPLKFGCNNIIQHRIDPLGVFNWYDGAGGTRMTLNATGLGVGASPAQKLTVAGSAEITGGVVGQGALIGRDGSSGGATYSSNTGNTNVNAPASGSIRFNVNNGTFAGVFDANANLGIGVTPSASWASNRRALQIGGLASGAVALNGTSGSGEIFFNSFFNTSTQNICVVTGGTGKYDFNVSTVGAHSWSVGTGTAGNAFSFTQAMTLDASGRLLVGTTDAGSNSGIGLKAAYSATAPYFATVGSSNASNTYSYLLYSTTDAAFKFYVSYSGQISATSGTISAISDARLKENVQDIDVGLGAILALKPRKFDWKEGKGKNIKGDRGFIAQEFEQVFPQLVDEWKDAAPEGEAPYKSVRQDLIPVLVKAIQELAAEVNALKNA